MSIKFELNKNLITYVYTASNLSEKAFSELLGVDPKTLKSYIHGNSLPRKPETIAKLQKLALKHGAGEIAATPVPALPVSAVPGEFAPEVLKALQEREGLDGKQMAEHLGIAASTWYHWLAGSTAPRFSKHEKLLRKALAKGQVAAASGADSPSVKSGKRQVSAELFHELGQAFHAHYRPRLTEATMDYALTLVCEKFQRNRREFRREHAAYLFLLKDLVTPQEVFDYLSGHS